jgi:hypothetical protein
MALVSASEDSAVSRSVSVSESGSAGCSWFASRSSSGSTTGRGGRTETGEGEEGLVRPREMKRGERSKLKRER